jgi:hypothetical protein
MSQKNRIDLTVIQKRGRMFKIEIDSIEDFITFVNIIRGDNPDNTKIENLTKELNKDSDELIKAEEAQEK